MTDKQIIDRVNVKECKYYCNGKCERYEEFVEADYANYSVKCICEKENDLGTYDICDYQQLKRKEQEVQEAMDNYVKLDNQRVKEYNELVDKYKAKEQECEKAKQNAQDTYDLWQALIESFNILQGEKIKLEQECEELKEALNEGCLHNLTLMTEQRVLLQTLTEIKEIAESEMDSKEFMAVQYMLNGNVDNKNKVLKQIIQKINEVLNA